MRIAWRVGKGAFAIAVGLGSLVSPAVGQTAPSPRWYHDLPQALQAAKAQKKLLFASFTTATCGPCTAYHKSLFPTAEFLNATRNMVLADIDVGWSPAIAAKYKATVTPDVRIYAPTGAVLYHLVGFNRPALLTKLNHLQSPPKRPPPGATLRKRG